MSDWTDETVLTETVGNEYCDYRLIKIKYKGKWTEPILEYNDYRGTGDDEWGEVQLFEHFSKGDIAYLKEKFGMSFPLMYEDTVEELIDTNDLVAFKESDGDSLSDGDFAQLEELKEHVEESVT